MLNISLLILFFIANTATFLCSMDPAPKRNSTDLNNKRKSLSVPITLPSFGLKASDKTKQNPLPTNKSRHGLLTAIEKDNIDLIKMYLLNPYLNLNTIKDINGDTPLLYAGQKKNFEFISHLLKNPIMDYSIQNKHGIGILKHIPQDAIVSSGVFSATQEITPLSQEEPILLRPAVFARTSLDAMANKQVKKYRPHYEEGTITSDILVTIAKETIKKAQSDEKAQKNCQDRAIPAQACYPDYATLEFVYQMILFRLAQQNSQ